MKRTAVCIALAAALGAGGADEAKPFPFAVPRSVASRQVDESGRTWRMTGSATNSFAVVHGEFCTNLVNAGYALRHEMPMDDKGDRILASWDRKGSEIILMLWSSETNAVNFAWGEVVSPPARQKPTATQKQPSANPTSPEKKKEGDQ